MDFVLVHGTTQSPQGWARLQHALEHRGHRGVSIEEIARLAGHASTRTTEIVYRRELRPVITTGRRDHGRALRRRLAPRAGRSAGLPRAVRRCRCRFMSG